MRRLRVLVQRAEQLRPQLGVEEAVRTGVVQAGRLAQVQAQVQAGAGAGAASKQAQRVQRVVPKQVQQAQQLVQEGARSWAAQFEEPHRLLPCNP